VNFSIRRFVFFVVSFVMFFVMFGRMPISMLVRMQFPMFRFVPFAVLRRGISGHGHFMHFVGKCIGLVLRLFMIGIMIRFVVGVMIGVLFGLMLCFQIFFRVRFERILQFFDLSGVDKGFGHGFNRFRPVFRLRFFVLRFRKLLG
jgi:hypothetical protein